MCKSINAEYLQRQQELTTQLREAADAYYNFHRSIMSDKEYDKLFDELAALEKKTGTVMAGSVVENVGAVPVSELKKIPYDKPPLSLDKTKSRDGLTEWLGDNTGCLSWKMDGLTIVLTYKNGKLIQAVTRGNSDFGEDVTHNAVHMHGIPLRINIDKDIIVRGEAVIRYSDFQKIKNTPEGQNAKNPRNLCSGTVSARDPRLLSQRPVWFYAFELVSDIAENSFSKRLDYLASLGFNTVSHVTVNAENLADYIKKAETDITENDFPSDGLVLQLDDVEYSRSLGTTGHHPKGAMAFKWQDITKETILRKVEWSPSATGRLNPVAVFDPVELEGTTVRRASIHNISYIEEKDLHIGDTITVYKANMIIPQIDENLNQGMYDDRLLISDTDIICPVCGSKAVIQEVNDSDEENPELDSKISGAITKIAMCPNPNCKAKLVGKFERMVCRDALNIQGLSSKTLDVLIDNKYLNSLEDIFELKNYPEIKKLNGMGDKKFDNIIKAIDKSASETELWRVLYSMLIPHIGRSASKDICDAFAETLRDKPESLSELTKEDICDIPGIGEILAQSFVEWFSDDDNKQTYLNVLKHVTLKFKSEIKPSPVAGKTFVITGKLEHYTDRSVLKSVIENAGGKVTGSVSKNTDYLINNDINSGSSKNKTAKALGVPIISEKTFITELLFGTI